LANSEAQSAGFETQAVRGELTWMRLPPTESLRLFQADGEGQLGSEGRTRWMVEAAVARRDRGARGRRAAAVDFWRKDRRFIRFFLRGHSIMSWKERKGSEMVGIVWDRDANRRLALAGDRRTGGCRRYQAVEQEAKRALGGTVCALRVPKHGGGSLCREFFCLARARTKKPGHFCRDDRSSFVGRRNTGLADRLGKGSLGGKRTRAEARFVVVALIAACSTPLP
jgi:hypothetical protein